MIRTGYTITSTPTPSVDCATRLVGIITIIITIIIIIFRLLFSCIKIRGGNVFRRLLEFFSRVPQDSFLGPLLCNIY
jgi:hypothetical protein